MERFFDDLNVLVEGYARLVAERGEVVIPRAAIHINRMSDGSIRVACYTDDGAGNGEHVASFFFEEK